MSHLRSVDDTMLFYFGNEDPFLILNHMVEFFEAMWGLKINRSNCQILGINYDQDKLRRQVDVIGCEVGSFPSSYLGLLLGGNPRACLSGTLFLKRSARGYRRGRKAFSPKLVD